MTPERAEALRVARAALISQDSAYGPADAIVTALHYAGLLRTAPSDELERARGEAEGHMRHAAALLETAQLATEYRVPVGADPGADWLWVRREPTGTRWAILASHRSSAGDRMAYVDGRWQPLPVAGPAGRWAYATADDALRTATRLAKEMASGDQIAAACGRCRRLFDPSDTRFDGHGRHRDTPWCRECVDRCHDSTDAFHKCPICTGGEGS